MARILIYLHRNGNIHDPCGYFLREIAACWQANGHELFVQHGPGERIDADILVNHVDLTVVPTDHRPYMAQYERTINAQVLDISKSTISRDLVTQSSGWEGAVIAKTDLNCGGWKEHDLGTGSTVPDANYLIFSSLGEVPDHIWQDSRFVVEKFLPEMRDGLYCLRTWMFLGDAETNSLSYSKSAIVKQHTVLRRVPTPRVPDELREIRKQLNFDFGKFDYALVDGRVVLYDANRTPSLGTFTRSEIRPRIEMLAAGLRSFL